MKRQVTLDARMWAHPGIGRYLRELVRAMLERRSDFDFTLLGSEALRSDLSGGRAGFRSARTRIYGIGEQMEIPLLSRGSALLHVPHFNIPVLGRVPLIVTVHDLIYLKQAPGSLRSPIAKAYARHLFRAIAKKARALLTVSEATKNDLLETLPGLDPQKVHVTYEAASPVFRRLQDGQGLEQARARFGLARPFVLFVGSLRAHKNVPALIRAMEDLRVKRGIPHELVLVGRRDERETGLLERIGRTPFVRAMGELPDEDLVLLYNLAEAFVLPSFSEGFGLPVLEAMACGTPVLASDRASLPEVVGDAGTLFDPGQIDALAGALYNVLNDKQLREKMSEKGLRRSQRFSWSDTAERTLEVYRRALA